MSLTETLRRLNRIQKSLQFKLIATAVALVLGIGLGTAYVVRASAPQVDAARFQVPDQEGVSQEELELQRSIAETAQQVLREVASGATGISMALGSIAAATGVTLVAIWLGVALTYLLLVGVALLVGLPLALFDATAGLGRVVIGAAVLTASFTALLEGARMLYSLVPGPVFGVARNVLSEAVRMKVSAVFIVLLIGTMALLPGMLSEETPLRYRVQNFLQYSMAGSFWILGFMTVLLSTATVAFEQRDRLIWQTMTKPVAPWKYLLGKLLGVCGLNAVLLIVTGTAVFLFTEHLRGQTAMGEIRPFVAAPGARLVSEDRAILTFQVLQARKTAEPDPPFPRDDPDFLRQIAEEAERLAAQDPTFQNTDAQRRKMADEQYKLIEAMHRAINPGSRGVYVFRGLGAAREAGKPLVLRYRFKTGSNRPDHVYQLVFMLGRASEVQRPARSAVDQVQVIDGIPPQVIDEDGTLVVQVFNLGLIGEPESSETINLSKDAFEITYSTGGYVPNLGRVMLVMWLKLAFFSAVSISVATFLSFPVACLIGFGTFFMAEGAGFIAKSVEYYGSGPDEGWLRLVQIVVYPIGLGVAKLFSWYAELNPVARLVDGRLISWPDVAKGAVMLALCSAVLYLLGVMIFRRRELAIYSGN